MMRFRSTAAVLPVPPAGVIAGMFAALPGLGLAFAVAGSGFLLHRLPGLDRISPLIVSIILGMAVNSLWAMPLRAKPGLRVASRRLLRLAVVLLGLQITFDHLRALGAPGMAVVALTLLLTFLLTKALGRLIGVERGLAELIAVGTAVCGASAVVAANTVTQADDEDVAYAIACVTVFGTLAMILYPLLAGALGLAPAAYGLWTGASIHEIAQVLAAGFQHGPQAGEAATVAKLARIALLAPLVLAMGLWKSRGADTSAKGARPPIPWFVVGFIVMIGVSSLIHPSAALSQGAATLTSVLMTVALAAMGLETSLGKLRARGLRPLLLGAASWMVVGLGALALVKVLTTGGGA
ncbi:YeiH family protein [Rhodospirillum rubrum]|uniref:Integral membrane protein (TIGR00698 family) n=1 Tax=Rhodospirillum rubrum (strain ATCC 11170 / ATH 1.1.1 / DSM 467 / LMG 4362 / NCIMB 8255 / S1) TaxID=269796 RepID=Q2RWT6_RHORT|nr:putative sulfate exporter family transporter [Rhodospirillum rubrum]ABC21409.1 conserved hypothetical protein [Rhodospirillum rubrum ATCC 11170]AEO47089.1 hypothetical protein F11_03095 [Rhodospirillum rubrum F11]MBK5953002.1 hypothetical protein [Rhodospirillum rubrum]QXG81086.1 putative sulfate exporter family transporter [Rhodospirillum rubrum]HAP98614.1 putative sulfate exporter family transporter [Rhodospirillum rubrum]